MSAETSRQTSASTRTQRSVGASTKTPAKRRKAPKAAASKRERLEAAGWKFGTAQEFLGLSDEDMELIELRRALLSLASRLRSEKQVSQNALAKLLGSSASRISKMETDDPSVGIALILRAIVRLGGTREQMGEALLLSYRQSASGSGSGTDAHR